MTAAQPSFTTAAHVRLSLSGYTLTGLVDSDINKFILDSESFIRVMCGFDSTAAFDEEKPRSYYLRNWATALTCRAILRAGRVKNIDEQKRAGLVNEFNFEAVEFWKMIEKQPGKIRGLIE